MIDLKQMQAALLLQWVGLCSKRRRSISGHIPKKERNKIEKNCSLWRQIFVFLFESEKSRCERVAADYSSILELCVKSVARLQPPRPFCDKFN